jgi:hypothetical protein
MIDNSKVADTRKDQEILDPLNRIQGLAKVEIIDYRAINRSQEN